MDRFCDYIMIYEVQGEIYNPYPDKKEESSAESSITRKLVYEGECKAKLTQFYGTRSIPEGENYTITIPDPDLTQINVRNIAYLKTNGNDNDITNMNIIEVKRYERNTVLHAVALKDGDTD